MSMGQGFHGLRAETPDNLVLDAGIVYFNIDESKLKAVLPAVASVTDALAAGSKAGATRGGASFASNKENRPVEADGIRFPVKGLQRIDAYAPTLTMSLLEVGDRENLQRMLASYVKTTHQLHDEYQLSVEVDDADYVDNVALVAKHTLSQTPGILVLRNVLVVESFEVSFEDKNEAVVEVKFLGHALLSAPHDSPFSWYVPIAEAGS